MPWPRLWTSASKIDNDGEEKGKTLNQSAGDAVNRARDAISERVPQETIDRVSQAVPNQFGVFAEPQTILATIVLTSASLTVFKFYRSFLRRIPEATNISQSFFRKRSVLGQVTSVGDGDNFRIYHTPGGWLAGWGWLPWRRVPKDKKQLKNSTIHVRLAGIDAPELAHFGRPSQPYSQEALDWLTSYVLGRRIRAYVHKPDQYSRVVATAYVWKGLLRRDVGLQMLRAGMATVYEAKTGAEFGQGLEKKYRNAEWWAKKKRKGMWAGRKQDYESPRAYKTRYGGGSPSPENPQDKK